MSRKGCAPESGVHVAAAGDEDVGAVLLHRAQQRARVALVEHLDIVAHQLADARLVLLGDFLVPVATTFMLRSCSAEITDQDLTPPV